MKSVSGKEFARLLERKGWELKRIKKVATTFTLSMATLRAFQFRYMATSPSRLDC